MYLKHLGDVAGAEDFMDCCEFMGLVRGEVGGEGALLGTSAPEELAGGARGDGVENGARWAQHLYSSSYLLMNLMVVVDTGVVVVVVGIVGGGGLWGSINFSFNPLSYFFKVVPTVAVNHFQIGLFRDEKGLLRRNQVRN